MRVTVKKLGKFSREIWVDGEFVIFISKTSDKLEVQPKPNTRVVLEEKHVQWPRTRAGPSGQMFIVYEEASR